VRFFEDDDPKMNAAIAKAQATLPDFNRALDAPKLLRSDFSIKTPITDGKETEHVWLHPVSFDGVKYHGVLNNRPVKVAGIPLGTKLAIEPKMVSDWMYIENGKLMGGSTIRVVRDSLGEKERQRFDRDFPFRLD